MNIPTCLVSIGVALISATLVTSSDVAWAHPAPENEWQSYGKSADEQRFSPLKKIDTSSISRLGLAWSVDLPREARSLEATPLEVDGVLYFTTSLSVVYALDAVTGRERWRYDPEVWKVDPKRFRTTPGDHRGVAYWNGHIILGAFDGRLISLDSKTGAVIWSVQTITEPNTRKTITGAPRIFGNKVIIGNAGADFGTRGYVTAYDTRTGKQVWRFYAVPGDPAIGFEDDTQAMAARTWGGEWFKWGGGGTVWNGITYDADLDRIYIGTGNSSNYNPEQRSPGGGDNLFLASIVALDANTGKYIWHYQVNPREAWDFKATADMVLANLRVGGRLRKVLMQAPTNGFFYVIDRDSGKLISAEKLGKVTWAERIDLKTGRPVEAPNIRYQKGPVTFWPSPWGVHNWQSMSFSPQTGLVYIPTQKLAATYTATPQNAKDAEKQLIGAPRYLLPLGANFIAAKIDPDDGTGGLSAWDPVQQKARWTVKYQTMWNGGTMATAGHLVFQGTGDGWFRAFDAGVGKELWKSYVGQGIIAPPITYLVNGEQYVTILAGYGGAIVAGGAMLDPGWRYGIHFPRVLTFKIDGRALLPATAAPDFSVHAVEISKEPIDLASATRGETLWNRSCIICHGVGGASAGAVAPDLRASAVAQNGETLRKILQDGLLARGGMPKFDDFSATDFVDIEMYIRKITLAAR